jgi:hypothetical protein
MSLPRKGFHLKASVITHLGQALGPSVQVEVDIKDDDCHPFSKIHLSFSLSSTR